MDQNLPKEQQHSCRNEPPPVVITIPARSPPYLAGARLLAVLADPPLHAGDSGWKRLERAYGRLVIEAQLPEAPAEAERPQSIIPAHAMLGRDEALKAITQAQKPLDARMGAASVVSGFIRRSGMMEGGVPNRHRRPPTIDQEIMKTQEQEAAREEWMETQGVALRPRFDRIKGNFGNRVLRPSMPVIHIAIAVANTISRSQRVARQLPAEQTADWWCDIGGPQISWADIVADPALSHAIIAEAQALEEIVGRLPVLKLRHGVPRIHLRLE